MTNKQKQIQNMHENRLQEADFRGWNGRHYSKLKFFQARTVEHFGHIDPRKLFEPHSCKSFCFFFCLMVGSSSSPVDLQYVGHVTVTLRIPGVTHMQLLLLEVYLWTSSSIKTHAFFYLQLQVQETARIIFSWRDGTHTATLLSSCSSVPQGVETICSLWM